MQRKKLTEILAALTEWAEEYASEELALAKSARDSISPNYKPRDDYPPSDNSTKKWCTFILELKAPIGKPKAARIIERLIPHPNYRHQLEVIMGKGSGSSQAVIAFHLKITDKDGDNVEQAEALAKRMNERGVASNARAKVESVEAEILPRVCKDL